METGPGNLVLPPGWVRPIGGRIRQEPEDFQVEELPLYSPSGEGEHLMLQVEKRDLTTPALIARLARALRIPERAVGFAGYKDRRAVTRQWLTVPRAAAAALVDLELPQARVLAVQPHANKLRVGHLRGNLFAIVVRGAVPGALEAAQEVLQRVRREGLPNGFGRQRFGTCANNHLFGACLVRGDAAGLMTLAATPHPARETPRVVEGRRLLGEGRFREALAVLPRDFRLERHLAAAQLRTGGDAVQAARTLPARTRDFLLSAWQSWCFNRVLEKRLPQGRRLLQGDIAMKHQNGACFRVADPEAEAARFAAGEISPTGPLPGRRMMRPEGEAGRLEEEVLRDEGFPSSADDRLLPARTFGGARRALFVPLLGEASALPIQRGDLLLRFGLPRGAFATTLLALLGLSDPAAGEPD